MCPPDKAGEYCREPTRALTSSVTTPGIVAIVVSAFVVICESGSCVQFLKDLLLAVHLHIEGSGPEWYISGMLYSPDIPLWSGTLNMHICCSVC